MVSVSTSTRGVRFTPYILGGNEWFRSPRHSVSGSTRPCLDLGLVVWKGERPRLRQVTRLVERLSHCSLSLAALAPGGQSSQALLTQHSKITSVIWLHDGIWIAPPPPTRLVQVVDQLICQEFGINTGQPIFSVKDLQQTYAALVNQLPSRRQKLPARGKTPLLGSLLPTIVITRTASRQTRREACTFYSRMEGL